MPHGSLEFTTYNKQIDWRSFSLAAQTFQTFPMTTSPRKRISETAKMMIQVCYTETESNADNGIKSNGGNSDELNSLDIFYYPICYDDLFFGLDVYCQLWEAYHDPSVNYVFEIAEIYEFLGLLYLSKTLDQAM